MSLINEALKRARVEAARRDAAAKGVPPSALPVYVPRRRRPWLGPLAGFLAGLAAVIVVAGAFWLARGSAPAAAAPEAAAPGPAESATVPAPVPEAPPPVPVPTPVAASAPRTAVPSPPPRVVEEPPPTVELPPPVTDPEAAPPAPRPSPPRPQRRESRPETTAGGIEAGRTYRVEATPASGKKVKLDFIVWSETPFAQINGKQISPGQMVDGYKLLAVERERVELEHGGRSFWLRVR